MTTKTIHFAHANGFPAGSYKKFLNALSPDYRIIAKDKFAHDDRYPLNDNWENQVDELIHYVEDNVSDGEKVMAIGHSFGGLLSYMAVCKKPELFSGLIMLDPPLITGLARYFFRFAKKNRLINKLTPAGITQTRIKKWDAKHDLHHYFANKQLFKDFDPDCLNDYIAAVTDEAKGSKHLNFDVSTEANIFRTIPHNLPSFKGKLSIPSTLITATHTTVCVPVLRNPFIRNNPLIKHVEFDQGGHMFPLEHPLALANLINKMLATTKNIQEEAVS